jgi:hypothetical protein
VSVGRGFDRQGITFLGPAQTSLGLPAFGVLLEEPRVQLGVPERDGGLRRQQLDRRAARRREYVRSRRVFQVEDADELGLLHQGYAEERARKPAAQVLVQGEGIAHARVIQDHARARALDMPQDAFGQVLRRRRFPQLSHHDAAAFCRCQRLDALSIRAMQDQEAAIGAGMFQGGRQERLDELVQHDFAGQAARHAQDRFEIQACEGRHE